MLAISSLGTFTEAGHTQRWLTCSDLWMTQRRSRERRKERR
jgi:hypothetical protein